MSDAPQPMHPVNGALRFGIELVMIVAIGLWGSKAAVGLAPGWVGGLVSVLVVGVAWGVFNVPGDPSRSGRAPVRVRGVVRLGIEAVLFGWAAGALADLAGLGWGVAFAAVVLVHVAWGRARTRWLIRQ